MKILQSAVCFLILAVGSAACAWADPGPSRPFFSRAEKSWKIKIQNKAPLKAAPFELADVRLLDGPFLEAMVRGQKFLLNVDIDRLLHAFRLNAGLPSPVKPYGGWEAPDVELRGHSLGHFLTACSLMHAASGNSLFKDRVNTVVSELERIQEALAKKSFNPGFLSAFPEEF
ncbi:MAG: glycoside hydrolase family 127 protein, partial [Clostridiales bacterium]|nr:glycoside hydrolase family 127 protein [Clostridiales bacterium]